MQQEDTEDANRIRNKNEWSGKCTRFRDCVLLLWLLATIGSNNDPYLGTHILACLSSNHIAVIAFQIVLCLIVECVGISIIWCSMLGWILVEVTCGIASNDTEPDRQAETSNAASPTWVGFGNLSSICSRIAVASTILCVDRQPLYTMLLRLRRLRQLLISVLF